MLNCRHLVDDINFSLLSLTTASSLVNTEDNKVLWEQQPVGTEQYNMNHAWW
jgi:hypothetical protein